MKRVLIGCSGWSYKDWRGRFYPEKLPARSWLEHYSERFPTVEINNTFYRLPTLKAVQGWVDGTPQHFVFSVKASRYITHIKRLQEAGERFKVFRERIEPLHDSGKLGPILWQFPASFHRDDQRLEQALAELPPWRHAFEFRHPSWFAPAVYDLLSTFGAALVIGDHPERPFQPRKLTSDWTLIRLHYGARGRGGNYAESELDVWKRRIAAWRSRAEVFAYFNNDWSGYAPRDAAYLQRHLS
jgi:uncharacterized protein YecE (DUF72 family)